MKYFFSSLIERLLKEHGGEYRNRFFYTYLTQFETEQICELYYNLTDDSFIAYSFRVNMETFFNFALLEKSLNMFIVSSVINAEMLDDHLKG